MHNPEILKDKRGSADTRPTRQEKVRRLLSLSEAARKQREGLGTRMRWLGPAQGSKVVGRVAPGGLGQAKYERAWLLLWQGRTRSARGE
jgi:hypothetical protein